jgi:brevican
LRLQGSGAMRRPLALALVLLTASSACARSDALSGGAADGSGGSDGAGIGGGGPGAGGDEGGEGGEGPSGPSSTASSSSGPGPSSSSGSGSASGGGEGGSGPVFVCGDGLVSEDEECDDGNVTAADGCTQCSVDCEPGATQDPTSGHCYRVFQVAITRPEAEAACAAWGGGMDLGHLASIESPTEQDLIFSLITDQTWIGIQDPDVEGVYGWSDGTPWEYEFWAEGEPDNTFEEDCAFMRPVGGGWNDHACLDPRAAYVCERRAAGTF